MSTPEGEVKKLIDALLSEFGIINAYKAGQDTELTEGWYVKPMMKNVSGIPDYLGHYRGHFFGVEAKAPKKVPKGFQELQIATIRNSGGVVFVVDGEYSLRHLRDWFSSRRRI